MYCVVEVVVVEDVDLFGYCCDYGFWGGWVEFVG